MRGAGATVHPLQPSERETPARKPWGSNKQGLRWRALLLWPLPFCELRQEVLSSYLRGKFREELGAPREQEATGVVLAPVIARDKVIHGSELKRLPQPARLQSQDNSS